MIRARSSYALFCLLASQSLVACGGKVVFEEGSGGAGGGSTSPSTSSHPAQTSTGTGASCTTLLAALEAAIADARACSTAPQIVQCDGSEILDDVCGCHSLLLNETQPEKVDAAKAARKAWVSAGCTPQMSCLGSCMVATSGFCLPSDGVGTCVSATPD